MSKATFPTLLTKKATMLASLTRFDLGVLGSSYLILSWMKVSGIYSVIVNAVLLLLLKVCQKRFMSGFFRFLNEERCLKWAYKLEGHDE